MKKLISTLSLAVIALFVSAQEAQNYSKEQIEQKLDSILQEANLLYKLEWAAWHGSDEAMKLKPQLSKESIGYITYYKDGVTRMVFVGKNGKVLQTHSFFDEVPNNCISAVEIRDLTQEEATVLRYRNILIDHVVALGNQLTLPQGYTPNLIVVPYDKGYRLYIVMGTSQSGVIPMGNDYIFDVDFDGNLVSWRKMHSGVLPIQNNLGEEKGNITEAIHSHLPAEPFITATDICLFRLYAPFQDGLTKFSVYSPLKVVFTYDLSTNTLVVEDMSDYQNRMGDQGGA